MENPNIFSTRIDDKIPHLPVSTVMSETHLNIQLTSKYKIENIKLLNVRNYCSFYIYIISSHWRICLQDIAGYYTAFVLQGNKIWSWPHLGYRIGIPITWERFSVVPFIQIIIHLKLGKSLVRKFI